MCIHIFIYLLIVHIHISDTIYIVPDKNVLLSDCILTSPILFLGQALLYIKAEIKNK